MSLATCPRRAAVRGFTLIEILAVLVVIGIAIALVRVNLTPNPAKVLEDEARRLALVFELARDEAMTSGCTLAWAKKGEENRFECRRGRVDPFAAKRNDPDAKRPWPPSINLERISIAGVPVPRDSSLLFTPSGINAPFELVLALEGHRIVLAGDLLGRVKVAKPDVQRGAHR